MTESNHQNDLFGTLARILLRCFVLGYGLLLLWFVLYICASDVIYGIHGKLFGLSPHEMDIIHYAGMAFVKCTVMLFFLFPYIAIQLVIRKRS